MVLYGRISMIHNTEELLHTIIQTSGRSCCRGWVESFLLGTGEIWACKLSPNSQQVKVILVMRHDDVHRINVTLPANLVSKKDIHGGSKTGESIRQGVVLCGLPGANKCLMSWRLGLLDWGHPPPNCSLESECSVLLDVFWMVQQICLDAFPSSSIVKIPARIKGRT